MKLKIFVSMSIIALSLIGVLTLNQMNTNPTIKPTSLGHDDEDDEDEEHQWKKVAPWSVEDAARHQAILEKYMKPKQPGPPLPPGVEQSFANGKLFGSWTNRGPYNMPGAFKFAEMLDNTDTIYGVTYNHYSGEYNSKSYIFKGTVYNPKTGTKGDDFVRLTGHWPNRYQDLIVIRVNSKTRLIAAIENGPIYFSDDDGSSWTQSTGLPSVIQSTAVNRQDNNAIYTTDGTKVYKSTNGGESFVVFQNFNTSANMVLYSPRYAIQANATNVYLGRNGAFYTLTLGGQSFISKGTYTSSHGRNTLSIAGDSRKLFVTENSKYWVSTNGGTSWTQKYPKGNWYGDRTGNLSAGKYLAAHPENPDTLIAGYAQPVYSLNGLDSDLSTDAGWGGYQNGTSLPKNDYYNRIRFNYHPDIQASQFFYNSSGDLFSIMSTDGGMFMSYKSWRNASESVGPDNTNVYSSATFININTLGTVCPLIYRNNLFTGVQDETHIYYSTQDQGTQNTMNGETGDLLSVVQSIGGDGPPLKSADGINVWKWQREGKQVWAPTTIYDGSSNRKSSATINGEINSNASVSFTKDSHIGWVQAKIDHDEPGKRIWILSKRLDRVEWNGSSLSQFSVSKGTGNQVAALAQAWNNPNNVYFLQEGKVFKSSNRGDSFDSGTNTPFSKTYNGYDLADFGGGWVLPTDDNWILFNGPSNNSVGSILSKDGGTTWTDVTGNYPAGSDIQTGGMVGTPDGKYVFAGTDIGPWVFVVEDETWYPIADGAANFNTTDIEYIAATKTVRFGTWGSGVWDFQVENIPTTPFMTINTPNGGEEILPGDIVNIAWGGYYQGDARVDLYKNGNLETNLATVTNGDQFYNWTVPTALTPSSNYKIKVSAASSSVDDFSDTTFSIVSPTLDLTSFMKEGIAVVGSVSNIMWNSNLKGSVRIQLYQGTTYVKTIATLSASVGEYNWTPASNLGVGSNYKLKLVSIENTSLVDYSSAFEVVVMEPLAQSHLNILNFDSEHSSERAANTTIDDLSTTFWHTEWSPGTPGFPHYISYSVDTLVQLAGFSYLPRQDGQSNGRVKSFQVEISNDGSNWTQVATGDLPDVVSKTTVSFPQTYEATYVKFTALSEQSGNFFASMAEFNLYYVPKDVTVDVSQKTSSKPKMEIFNLQPQSIGVNVSQAGNYNIQIISLNGQVLKQKRVQLNHGLNEIKISIPNRSVIIQLIGEGTFTSRKFIQGK